MFIIYLISNLISIHISQQFKGYEDLSYQQIIERFKKIEADHGDIFQLQDNFLNQKDELMVECGEEDCKYFYAKIGQNQQIYDKPAILLVGGFHGNERLGSTIITELAQTIVDHRNDSPFKYYLEDRLIILMPMVNPSGHYLNIREERQRDGAEVDVNRDFSYNTKAARALANIYKQYIIVSGLTFHGGDNVISWPWGSENHKLKNRYATNSPDEKTFAGIADVMRQLSLKNKNLNIQQYTLGKMTDTIYSLNGAYEDWAYAAGWEKQFVEKQCKNQKSQYQIEGLDGSPKALIYLVEADQEKIPKIYTWGNQETTEYLLQQWPPIIYNNASMIELDQSLKQGFGHITRNILLSLGLIDMSQPYLLEDIDGFRVGGCIQIEKIEITDQSGQQILTEQYRPGIWDEQNHYKIKINPKLISEVTLTCDPKFKQQISPDPNLIHQSYLMESRMNQNFSTVIQHHKLLARPIYSFTYDNGFKYLSYGQKKANNQTQQQIDNSTLNSQKQQQQQYQRYLHYILAVMILIAIILSFLFYKYCNPNDGSEISKMIPTSIPEIDPTD